MRVAVVTESFLPHINGVTNCVLRVCEQLHRQGHDALVIAPGAGPTEWCGFPVVRTPSLPLPGYRDFRLARPFPRTAGVLRDFDPDVVHLASPTVLGAQGAFAARRLGVPVVAVYQLRVNGVERVSRWARGVYLRRLHPARRDVALHLSLSGGALSSDTSGGSPAATPARAPAPSCPVPGFPGRRGAGHHVREPRTSGLPLVAPAAGGLLDLVDHGRTGLSCTPGSGTDLRDCIVELAGDPGLRRRMRGQARADVAGRGWNVIGAELVQHYREVLVA